MGPYCMFCGSRCFVPVLASWPKRIIAAYGNYALAATCAAGQAYERAKLGYCYDDAKREA